MCDCANNNTFLTGIVKGMNGKPGGNTTTYLFDSTSLSGSPGATYFRLNNTAFSTVTSIILDKHNSDNTDVSGFLSTFNNNGEFGIINLFNTTDSTLFANYIITGYSLVGSVTTLTVTYTNSNSFFNPNDLIGISFTPAGTRSEEHTSELQ